MIFPLSIELIRQDQRSAPQLSVTLTGFFSDILARQGFLSRGGARTRTYRAVLPTTVA